MNSVEMIKSLVLVRGFFMPDRAVGHSEQFLVGALREFV